VLRSVATPDDLELLGKCQLALARAFPDERSTVVFDKRNRGVTGAADDKHWPTWTLNDLDLESDLGRELVADVIGE
jgi:hypothetical protein